MPSAGSKSGALAILGAFVGLLDAHLQAELDVVTTDAGIGALVAPSSPTSIITSRVWPQDQWPSIQLVKSGSSYVNRLRQPGAPTPKNVEISVTIQHATTDLGRTETELAALTLAVERVIDRYWRTTCAVTRLQDVDISTSEESDSLREQQKSSGNTMRGSLSKNWGDRSSLTIDCVQSVYAPINL